MGSHDAKRRTGGVHGTGVAFLFAGLSTIGLIGAILAGRALAQAPDEAYLVPSDTEVAEDQFLIPQDTASFGLPEDGMAGALGGPPTVAAVQVRWGGTPTWEWLTADPAVPLKIRTGSLVSFNAVPAGGEWDTGQPQWAFMVGRTPAGSPIMVYKAGNPVSQPFAYDSTTSSDYRWGQASSGGTSRRANLLVGPCEYLFKSRAEGDWEVRSLWYTAAGTRRHFRAFLLPSPSWLAWDQDPNFHVTYTWNYNMDPSTAQPDGTCSTNVFTRAQASAPLPVGGTANLEYPPLWKAWPGLSSQVQVFYTDMIADGLAENREENPGAYVEAAGTRRRVYLQEPYPLNMPGNMVLKVTEGADKIELWTAQTGGTRLEGQEWQFPANNWAEVWVQGVSPSGVQRDVVLELSYTRDGTTATDTVKFTVVGVDLDIQDVDDAQEEDPGGYVGINKDDDDGNGVPDKDDPGPVAGERDLLSINLRVEPQDLTQSVTLSGDDGIYYKVWSTETKEAGSLVDLPETYANPGALPATLHVEGLLAAGPRTIELSCRIGDCTFSDRVKFGVVDVQVDLDIEGLEAPEQEPQEEDPGGFLAVNGFLKLLLEVAPDGIGPVDVDVTSGEERILLWDDQWQPLEAHEQWATGADVPPYLWAAGIVPSDAPRDVTVQLAHSTMKDIVNLTVVELNLKSVTFGPDPNANPVNYHDVAYDATGAPYPTPQWLDSNGDGDANDQGDNWSPVCYIRNTKMMVTVTVMLAPAAAFGEVVKIKGDGPGNLDFPETVATVQNGEATISGVVCDNPFPEVVHWYYDDGLEITWTLSRDGGGTWVGAPMKSKNEAFITLEQPACATCFRTVLYLATSNGGVSHDGCVANTWSSFSTGSGPMNADAWDDAERAYTRPLYYYSTHDGDHVYTAAGLLAGANGQCGAWADLLRQCLLANSIDNAAIQLVLPPFGYTQFAVKSIGYVGPPAYPQDDPWIYSEANLDITAAGVPGQNMATPEAKLFLLHYMVHRGNTYYDPSYGVTAGGAHEYTGLAIDAWAMEILGVEHWRKTDTDPAEDLRFP